MTNFERIKNMTLDEMTEFFNDGTIASCTRCIRDRNDCICAEITCVEGIEKWLESEVEE